SDRPDAAGPGRERIAPMAAFVVVYCEGEPARAGEAIVLPAGNRGSWSVLGRGAGGADDPHPRLQLVRCRPGQVLASEPLSHARISRVHLRARARGADEI